METQQMELQIHIQGTPNPNALKFLLSEDVKTVGKVTFEQAADAADIPLAKSIFDLDGVLQVHFFENVVTVTQEGHRDWNDLEKEIEAAIRAGVPDHNPDFEVAKAGPNREDLPPAVRKIEEILDKEIRPALQFDGGDLNVLGFEDNIVTVRYEGACGTCPSAQTGTLEAIKSVLRDEFNPDINVVAI